MTIVWAIAAAFWMLFRGQIWLVDLVAQSDWVPEWLTASSVKPVDCSVIVQDTAQGPLDAESLERARSTAFEMGFVLGMHAALRNAGVSDSEQNREARSALALELGTPAPELPPLRSPSYALTEFRAHMVADPQCVGAFLAKFYSPRHDALYRFGAFAGYNILRARFPQLDPYFVPDLRRFGKSAGLPQEVWGRFTDPTADVRTALVGVKAYLRSESSPQK